MAYIDDIIADLTTELSITDENFNSALLEVKVRGAYKDVKLARAYPSFYTDEMIEADMENFYQAIRNIALYDYNQIGAEFQTSSSENSNSRQWVSRDSLFNEVIPLAKV